MTNAHHRLTLPTGLPPDVYITSHQLSGDIKRLQKTVNSGIMMKLAVMALIDTPNLGVAKMNVGPPITLPSECKLAWEAEINRTYLRLIRRFIFPDFERLITKLKTDIKTKLELLGMRSPPDLLFASLMPNLRQGSEIGHKQSMQKLLKLKASLTNRKKGVLPRNFEPLETDIKPFYQLPWFPTHKLASIENFLAWLDQLSLLKLLDGVSLMMDLPTTELSTPEALILSPIETQSGINTPKATFISPSIIDLLSPEDGMEIAQDNDLALEEPRHSIKTLTSTESQVTPRNLTKNDKGLNTPQESGVSSTSTGNQLQPITINLNCSFSKVYKIEGDGNCLFRSLALGILKTQEHHSHMRTTISIFLARYEKRFAPFFYPEKIPGARVIPKTFSQYVDLISLDGVYGGALEITATAEIWSLGIWVFDETEKLHSVWDELNEKYICLRYTLLHKHYELIEVLGKLAYQTLLLSRDRRLKSLSSKQTAIDLSTPEVSTKRMPSSSNQSHMVGEEGSRITSTSHPRSSQEQAEPIHTIVAEGKSDSTRSKWGYFPIPSHDTPLRNKDSVKHSYNGGTKSPKEGSFVPLHYEKMDYLPHISMDMSTTNQADELLTKLKTLKGKKRRTVYNMVRKYFQNQRSYRNRRLTNYKNDRFNFLSTLEEHHPTIEEETSFPFTVDPLENKRDPTTPTTVVTESRTNMELPKDLADSPHLTSIFNFSSHVLGPGEVQLLNKGLSFSPSTNVINRAQVQIDLYKFCRNVRLKKHFEIHPSQTTKHKHMLDSSHKFNLESSFDPEIPCKLLNTYLESVKYDINNLLKKNVRTSDNLPSIERTALNSLLTRINNKEISVVLADKGGGTVVLDSQMYKEKGDLYFTENKDSYNLIADSETCILKALLKTRSLVIKELLETKTITLKHKKFAEYNLNSRITGIKFLFKIHKSLDLQSIPLRPIHPSIGSPNHNLSLLLDALISPYVNSTTLPTLLRDTNQLLLFLRKLGPLPTKIVVATSDITSLYTNIPHEKGVETMTHFLTKHSDYSSASIKAITKAVKHVVSLNYLRWQDSLYQQVRGVAMGTPLAVSYANIFMGAVDEILASKAPYIVKHFRFIDDNLFLIPTDKIQEIQYTAENLGFPTIKSTWTVDFDNNGISFLDTWICIKDNHVHTRLFSKPTDKHLYLHPSSYHPKHIISNIPYSILSRVRRLCSDEQSYEEDKNKALHWLKERGYGHENLATAITKVESQSGWEHILAIENRYQANLQKTTLESQTIKTLPLILTFNSKLKKAPALLFQHRQTLAATLKQPHRALVAFRRNKNLTDLLVHPSYRKHIQNYPGNPTRQEGFHHCRKNLKYRLKTCICGVEHSEGCRVCAHSVNGLTRIPKTKVKVLNGQSADCHSKNVVYAIWCRVCTMIYVGETTQSLSVRFDQHLRLMRAHTSNEVLYQHFRMHHPSNAFIIPLETVRKLEPKLLQIKESQWINKLGCLVPNGLNTQLDLDQKYRGIPTSYDKTNTKFTPTPARARAGSSTPKSQLRPDHFQLDDNSESKEPNKPKVQNRRPALMTPKVQSRNIAQIRTRTPSDPKCTPLRPSTFLFQNVDKEPFVQISPYVFHTQKRKGRCFNFSAQRAFFPSSP